MIDNGQARPDPDRLLEEINGNAEKKAVLKIFFGMAAGAGKTYAMLEEAHRLLAMGRDVVAGYIEPHARPDTARLAEGIQSVRHRVTEYRGMTIDEMDLDAVLSRRPAIALVDELAHTNAPDSRHPKRYQDVMDLLDAGISVYTTLNVQHLESRAGTVNEITGITVQETLPDSILERADEIELVDISPEALINRLNEGKIYPPERAKLAMENFFNIGNLNALREMALRFTADTVDHSLQDYRKAKKIDEAWKTGDRLLVAVSPSPFSESLVRWTRRMAYSLGASWIALNVETSSVLTRDDEKRLQKNLSLARELGAEIVITRDEDVTSGILRIARQRNITQIVAGKPGSGSWRDFFLIKTPVKRLIRESGNIDLYIIRADESDKKRKGIASLVIPELQKPFQYFALFIMLSLVIMINLLLLPLIGARSVSLILLLSILVLALFLERFPVFIYAAMTAFLWNILFLDPRFTLYITHVEDAIMFIMYFIVAMTVGSLASRIRRDQKGAVQREEQLNILYDMTRRLTASLTIDEALEQVMQYIDAHFQATTILYLRSGDGSLSREPVRPARAKLGESDYSLAEYSFTTGRSAGRFTDTLPSSGFLLIPVFFKKENIVGVLAITFPVDAILTMEQRSLLETMVSHMAMVIEREFFIADTQKIKLHEESEKMYRILMDSVTHEIRTPLTAIKGSLSAMLDPSVGEDADARRNLLAGMRDSTERLIRLVENLLDMSRIDSGKQVLNFDWNDMSDIIGTVLDRVEPVLKNNEITVSCPETVPLVRVDYNLLAQALYCVVSNAVLHNDPGTAIAIIVMRNGSELVIRVDDNGRGIPPGEREKLFDKFYRAGNSHNSGLGLGLSITRGIIELHGGYVEVENNHPAGAGFIMHLPVEMREKGE